ncbi:hypothetical protein EXM22_01020 [Oceanispirochaeta crateris]|uniref:Uncharacterized protein n=1 Tax=Oceanispirochaeta crateris TaxID=2518645 RepID=A0A5C1QH34_9SPIO|nr:hypothetical protein [Oceanispirochaeta crateris]QEN06638.1 hypothetical protein EXM22_01020 [Oceanispirochaeta crateris]
MGSMRENTDFDINNISEEDKETILIGIERKFSNFFFSTPHEIEYKSHSKGLILPATVIMIAILLSLIGIFIFGNVINKTYTVEEILSSSVSSDSEWAILKAFQDEASLKIRSKEKEITVYKERIAEYDQRLNSLRDLIELKKQAEKQFSEERTKLSLAGLTREAIDSRMISMENDLLLNLTNEMVEFYSLSLDDLNLKIDEILNERNETEEVLEAAVSEKELLVEEQQNLQGSIESLESPASMITEQENPIINDSELKTKQSEIFMDIVQRKFLEIFQDIQNENPQEGLAKLTEIEKFMKDQNETDRLVPPKTFEFYQNLIPLLQENMGVKITSQNENSKRTDRYSALMTELGRLSRALTNEYASGEYRSKESELRQKIDSIPELSNAFYILQKIDSDNIRNQESPSLSTESEVDSTLEAQSVNKKNEEPDIITGMITKAQFNKITIQYDDESELKIGAEFTVVKDRNKNEELVLASGIITSFEEGFVLGELEILYDFSVKPEAGDQVVFQSDTKGN